MNPRTVAPYRRMLNSQIRSIQLQLSQLIRNQDMYNQNEYRNEYRRLRRRWNQIQQLLLEINTH